MKIDLSSSTDTFVSKIIFPFMFVFVGPGILIALFLPREDPKFLLALIPFSIGLIYSATIAKDLAHVAIDEQNLIVSNCVSVKQSIPFSNIESVTESSWFRPRRVCITFRENTDFGRRIAFLCEGNPAGIIKELQIRAIGSQIGPENPKS